MKKDYGGSKKRNRTFLVEKLLRERRRKKGYLVMMKRSRCGKILWEEKIRKEEKEDI